MATIIDAALIVSSYVVGLGGAVSTAKFGIKHMIGKVGTQVKIDKVRYNGYIDI